MFPSGREGYSDSILSDMSLFEVDEEEEEYYDI